MGRQQVGAGTDAVVLDRAVVDVHAGVVAGWTGQRRPTAQREVGLGRREHDPVEVVDPLAVVLAGLDDPTHLLDERAQVVEADVPQGDRGVDLLERDAQAGGVTERAV